MNPMMGYHGQMMGHHWLWALLFFVLVVFVVSALIIVLRNIAERRAGERKSPVAILKQRYASGEINRDEFQKMKKDILGD